MSRILEDLGIDQIYIILALAALVLVLIIIVIVLIVRTSRLAKKYDRFMRGRDADSLEDAFIQALGDIKDLQKEDRANKESIKTITKAMNRSYNMMGIVKYDAFPGMGGKSSFALALMAQNRSGYVLNAIHSRESCYVYVKEIIHGETESQLGKEEEKAVKIALGIEKN